MKRILLAAALSAAALLGLTAAPASASIYRAPSAPAAIRGIEPCVTTTWRAQYWGVPKTQVGEVCYATPDMWVSKYWPRLLTFEHRGQVVRVIARTV